MNEEETKTRTGVMWFGAIFAALGLLDLVGGEYAKAAFYLVIGAGLAVEAVVEKKPWLVWVQRLLIVVAVVIFGALLLPEYLD